MKLGSPGVYRVGILVVEVDVVFAMVEEELALRQRFHLVGFCQFSPTRARKISLVHLIGNLNYMVQPGLREVAQGHPKCPVVSQRNLHMLHEVTPDPAWHDLKRKNN